MGSNGSWSTTDCRPTGVSGEGFCPLGGPKTWKFAVAVSQVFRSPRTEKPAPDGPVGRNVVGGSLPLPPPVEVTGDGHLGSRGPGSEATVRRILVPAMCSARESATHEPRSRQLPTNQDHAARRRSSTGATREYQLDQPSRNASLPGPGLPRDGPSMRHGRKRGALTGLVYISGAAAPLCRPTSGAIRTAGLASRPPATRGP